MTRKPPLTPLRGFLFSFTAGLALLFGGHGLVKVAFAAPPLYAPDHTA
jgi:hypothetical protein